MTKRHLATSLKHLLRVRESWKGHGVLRICFSERSDWQPIYCEYCTRSDITKNLEQGKPYGELCYRTTTTWGRQQKEKTSLWAPIKIELENLRHGLEGTFMQVVFEVDWQLELNRSLLSEETLENESSKENPMREMHK